MKKEKNMSDKFSSTAKVVDGILILSLPDAISPVVWQMELGQSKSSALEVRPADNGTFILTLKTPRQDVLEIATYASRDDAVKALLATSEALEKGQGQLKSGEQYHYPVPALSSLKGDGKSLWFWVKRVFYTFMILILTLLAISVLYTVGKVILSGPASPTSSSTESSPISADDFLESR